MLHRALPSMKDNGVEKPCCRELVEASTVEVGGLLQITGLGSLCCSISLTVEGLDFFGTATMWELTIAGALSIM